MPVWLLIAVALWQVNLSNQELNDLDHLHGSDGIPDWYDTDCCNLQDCKPVDDETITFGKSESGAPVVIYTEAERPGYKGGVLRVFVYEKSRWRTSKDERYHACHRGDTVYCVYIRPGV